MYGDFNNENVKKVLPIYRQKLKRGRPLSEADQAVKAASRRFTGIFQLYSPESLFTHSNLNTHTHARQHGDVCVCKL